MPAICFNRLQQRKGGKGRCNKNGNSQQLLKLQDGYTVFIINYSHYFCRYLEMYVIKN